MKSTFLTGVIEGFYGRPWSFETRMAYADYLAVMGLNSYIYCPKADPYLRKRWHESWPPQLFAQLKSLSIAYKARSVQFGLGLSPFALYQDYSATKRALLQRKVSQLNELQAPILAILFDDMPGSMDALASRQLEIVMDIVQWSEAQRIIVCPTYYSFDPVLEKYFGQMPQGYWQQLGAELPANIDILWTGNQVCSESVTTADIQRVQQELGRAVMLWDNYPVNDGALRSNFLYTKKLPLRDQGLDTLLSGHLCNPMNQGVISLLALQGLAELYGKTNINFLRQNINEQTLNQLAQNKDHFQQLGLTGLGELRCQELSKLYGALPGPAAAEVAGWLRGEYTFDPSCLTD